MDSNVEIVAPVVGDIGSCGHQRSCRAWAATGRPRRPRWTSAVSKKREENVAKMAPRLMNNNSPMDYHGALGVLRDHQRAAGCHPGQQKSANTLDLARGIIDRISRANVWTSAHGASWASAWAMPSARPSDRQAGARGRGRQRLRFLRHGGRDDLPVQAAGLRRYLQ